MACQPSKGWSAGKEETFDQLSLGRGRGVRNAEAVVNRESTLIRIRVLAAETESAIDRLPQVGLHTLQPAQPQAVALPARIEATELQGNAEARMGVLGLEAIDDITILCVPDLMSPRVLGDGDALTRQTRLPATMNVDYVRVWE